MLYAGMRQLLFTLDPETAHRVSLDWLGVAERLRLTPGVLPQVDQPVDLIGLRFRNQVGLAAGLDKNGDYIDALGALGFGFIEIGTVTPRPQPGNPGPRLFRLPQQRAIINRMGFNNLGVDHLLKQVQRARYDGVLGINIGKNATTPVEDALSDYLACLDKVYPHASYVTINISSPNTPGLRSLQVGESLDRLLHGLKEAHTRLHTTHQQYVPLVLKIAPDMNDDELTVVADRLRQFNIDAVIATNTTLSRDGVEGSPHAGEAGGLSGAPLKARADATIRTLHQALGDQIPIIGVGGIMSAADALDKQAAGARLVQVYTGFIYEGPRLIWEAARALQGT